MHNADDFKLMLRSLGFYLEVGWSPYPNMVLINAWNRANNTSHLTPLFYNLDACKLYLPKIIGVVRSINSRTPNCYKGDENGLL